MSNYLAIATVTAALAQLLQSYVGDDVPGALVTNVRPDSNGNGTPSTGVNLYLYQVTPNSQWRNHDVPTRDSRGRLVQRPRIALDLHYLLTFYGDDTQWETQRILGSAVRTLHTQPQLTRQNIEDALNANAILAPSNLAEETELVKFTPIPLSLEELSKLWSVFFQIPYTLSLAYQATVVFIEAEDAPRAVLPVQARTIRVVPFRQPEIEAVQPEGNPLSPILPGTTLLIRGHNLRGDQTSLLVAGVEVQPASVTPTEIRLSLSEPPFPAGQLRAGVQGVQVVHGFRFGWPDDPQSPLPTDPHQGPESNVAPFVLRPLIAGAPQFVEIPGDGEDRPSQSVTVTVNPPIRQGQRVVLLLNEMAAGATAAAYTFATLLSFKLTEQSLEDLQAEGVPDEVLEALESIESQVFPSLELFLDALKTTLGEAQAETFKSSILQHAVILQTGKSAADSDSVTLALGGVKAADYLLRVQVDGGQSLLQVDENPNSPTFNQYIGPTITIP